MPGAVTVERQYSTKWWNVIRRQMNNTPVTYQGVVACPDCGGPTHLERGRFGRFYACDRYNCYGTVGARLDGTPRVPRGVDETTWDAQRAAAMAVGATLTTAKRFNIKQDPAIFSLDTSPVYDRIIVLSGVIPGGRNKIHLRKRTLQEAEAIHEAAIKVEQEYLAGIAVLDGDVWARMAFTEGVANLKQPPSLFEEAVPGRWPAPLLKDRRKKAPSVKSMRILTRGFALDD